MNKDIITSIIVELIKDDYAYTNIEILEDRLHYEVTKQECLYGLLSAVSKYVAFVRHFPGKSEVCQHELMQQLRDSRTSMHTMGTCFNPETLDQLAATINKKHDR